MRHTRTRDMLEDAPTSPEYWRTHQAQMMSGPGTVQARPTGWCPGSRAGSWRSHHGRRRMRAGRTSLPPRHQARGIVAPAHDKLLLITSAHCSNSGMRDSCLNASLVKLSLLRMVRSGEYFIDNNAAPIREQSHCDNKGQGDHELLQKIRPACQALLM